MSEFDHHWIGAILAILLLILCGITLYVAYFKIDEIESHLQNCPVVVSNKEYWRGRGPFERTQRLITIELIFSFGKIWHGTDNLDMNEVKNFPISLKRWLLYPQYFSYILFLAMAIYFVWDKWFLPS